MSRRMCRESSRPSFNDDAGEFGLGGTADLLYGMTDLVPIRRALVSVSDKTGLLAFAQTLRSLNIEIISTGGTADLLKKNNIPVTLIDAVTGFPEIMDGRVKTLHPKVHGGLLARRDDAAHVQAMSTHDIKPIDLVCVNLYPFEQTIAKPNCTRDDAIENIDIGGPSMIRSAAKNHEHVTVVTSVSQYARVTQELTHNRGATTKSLRAALAGEAFALTAKYDAAIAAYLAPDEHTHHASLFPQLLNLSLTRREELRYGENPHQRAALYGHHPTPVSLTSAEQLHGKELSYNNINDAAAALELAISLRRVDSKHAGACVIKHTNPCGCSIGATVAHAIDFAIAGDPIAAYGGILAANVVVDEAAASRICNKECFFEVVIAPGYSPAALAMIQSRWANVRILKVGDIDAYLSSQSTPHHASELEFRSIPGGVLVQDRDLAVTPTASFNHRAGPTPTSAQLSAVRFLETTGRFLLSNAVVLGGTDIASDGTHAVRMFGGGAGQMDRVTSCRLAIDKAGPLAAGSIAFSDAFFPFGDGPQLLITAGVNVIAHPGGSKRDQETFDLCEKNGVTCLTTGVRHFRH